MTDSGICSMTVSRIKNLTSKNLPKISEAFTIVKNLTPSNAWFEGVSLRPWVYSVHLLRLFLAELHLEASPFPAAPQSYYSQIWLLQKDYLGMVPVFPDVVVLGQFPGKYNISSIWTALALSALIVLRILAHLLQ